MAYVLGVFFGALWAPRLLSLRYEWSHHQYSSPRYDGWQGLIDGVFIIVAGAFAGRSVASFLMKCWTAIYRRDWRALRPSVVILIDIVAWAVIAYLTFVANFLERARP